MEQTRAEKSYDYNRKKLAGGDLPPGQRLVNRVLADEIGGSVIPVREAIHRLAREVLIEHVPGSGAFVRKTDPHDLDNLYVLRDALESCAAGVAAQTCSGKRDLIEALRHRDHQRARKLMSEQVQRGRGSARRADTPKGCRHTPLNAAGKSTAAVLDWAKTTAGCAGQARFA